MRNIDEVIRILKKNYRKFQIPLTTKISLKRDPYKILISCILSLRTKDSATAIAFNKLFSLAKNPQQMSKLRVKDIETAIKPVNYYKTKAKRIKEISSTLVRKYSSKVPADFEELMKLKGVGRKTANIVMGFAFKHPEALPVDVHVHVISNRLGIVKTRTANETEKELRKTLPKKYWPEYNTLLVAYGQAICRTRNPKCWECYIINYCSYPKKNLNRK